MARQCADTPVIAIGGVTAARVPELLAAGAYGVAVVGAVSDAADPSRAVAELLAARSRPDPRRRGCGRARPRTGSSVGRGQFPETRGRGAGWVASGADGVTLTASSRTAALLYT